MSDNNEEHAESVEDTQGEEVSVPPETVQELQFPPVGQQIDPTGDMAKPVTPEEILGMTNTAKKDRWLAIFIQLCRSPRFVQFVEMNYVVRDSIDEEKKQIETQVLENPKAVGPALSRAQIAKMYSVLKTYSTRHPHKALQDILSTLSQGENTPSILVHTEADLDAAVREAGNKIKLD